MVWIETKSIENAFSPIPRNAIDSELTSAPSSIEFQDICTLDWNDLEEVPREDWELGGLSMTTEAIRALIAGE